MSKLLVVVDYQNDFVNGSLGFPKAVQLEDKIYHKVERAIENNEVILFTYDTHFSDYLTTREGKALPIKHCICGTDGHDLYGRLQDFMNMGRHREKYGFGLKEHSIDDIENEGIEEIELVGVVTNICVISNAVVLQSVFPEATITVDASCCASFDDVLHEKALDVMEGLQIKVINREAK